MSIVRWMLEAGGGWTIGWKRGKSRELYRPVRYYIYSGTVDRGGTSLRYRHRRLK